MLLNKNEIILVNGIKVMLTEETLIDKGDKGIFVTILQATLFCQGYAPGYIDGDFGTKTRTAVLEVQRKYKLTRDGIVGSNTWSALFN